MGNYPRFFGKDASNIKAWANIEEAETEINATIAELDRLRVDLQFMLMMLRASKTTGQE